MDKTENVALLSPSCVNSNTWPDGFIIEAQTLKNDIDTVAKAEKHLKKFISSSIWLWNSIVRQTKDSCSDIILSVSHTKSENDKIQFHIMVTSDHIAAYNLENNAISSHRSLYLFWNVCCFMWDLLNIHYMAASKSRWKKVRNFWCYQFLLSGCFLDITIFWNQLIPRKRVEYWEKFWLF